MLGNALLLFGGIWCACSELAAILTLEGESNKAALMSEAGAEAVAGRLLTYWKTIFVNYNDIRTAYHARYHVCRVLLFFSLQNVVP